MTLLFSSNIPVYVNSNGGVVHVYDALDESVNVISARLHCNAVGPVDLKMANQTPVTLANIEQPVQNVVVVFSLRTILFAP